ncbi:MAG: helix-turn-helix transcriptional regulator [Lachnospiraceae bacterium]|nr:helix-turn-helix transcriptional regulator [Lachnospiraceae bacterium]
MGLKQARKRKGLSQMELAKLIGLKQVTISQYESGARTPDLNTSKKLADALEMTLDEFFLLINISK